jgi:two-component system cell cycle response regulator DivK
MSDAAAGSPAKHVLLVDDYADALEIWTMLLHAYGYTVATAKTGAAALERAVEQPLHAIVLDLQLPDLSGVEVGRRLRQRPETADVLLIALTGRALTPAGRSELGELFDAVLIKPCEPQALIERLEGPRAATPRIVEESSK